MSHSPSPSPGCCAARLEQNRCTKSGVSQPFTITWLLCSSTRTEQVYKVRCLTALHHHLAVVQLDYNRTGVQSQVSHSPSPSPGCCAARLEQNRCTKSGVSQPFTITWLLCSSTRTEQVYKVRCLTPLLCTWLLHGSAKIEQVSSQVSHSPSPSPGCCAARLKHNRCTKSGV